MTLELHFLLTEEAMGVAQHHDAVSWVKLHISIYDCCNEYALICSLQCTCIFDIIVTEEQKNKL